MKNWIAGVGVLFSLGSVGPVGATGPGLSDHTVPPVDMAIEWLPTTRPTIAPLGGGVSRTLPPASNATASELTEMADQVDPAASLVQVWRLGLEDRRLSIALQRWSAVAGWQLVWEAERDFPIEAHIQIRGDFSSALQEVMKSLAETDYPLQAVLNTSSRILRVRRQHESRS